MARKIKAEVVEVKAEEVVDIPTRLATTLAKRARNVARKDRKGSKVKAEVVEQITEEITEEVAETEEERIAREAAEEAERLAAEEAEKAETERLAAEAENAAEVVEEAEAKTASTLVPAYLLLGQRLIELQARFKSLKVFGQFLQTNHPKIAEIPSDLRSNCKWLAENINEILNAFGFNAPDQLPWANPATIKRKFIAWQDAQTVAEDLAEDVEAEDADEEANAEKTSKDETAEAIEAFIEAFGRMTKASMIETCYELVKIGVDRKLKISDLKVD